MMSLKSNDGKREVTIVAVDGASFVTLMKDGQPQINLVDSDVQGAYIAFGNPNPGGYPLAIGKDFIQFEGVQYSTKSLVKLLDRLDNSAKDS
jgi:hypothetical protein